LEFFADVWANKDADGIAKAVLSNTSFWNGTDLSAIDGLTDAVAGYLKQMAEKPVRDVVASLV
jgi:tagaturonate reductase